LILSSLYIGEGDRLSLTSKSEQFDGWVDGCGPEVLNDK
jgi:hypothetical protein